MEKLLAIIVSIATAMNSILIIVNFLQKAKKPVDNAVDKKFNDVLKPINKKLDGMNADIKKLDKNQCMNYLVEFIEEEIENLQKTISSAKDIAEKRELVLKLSQKIKEKQNLNKVN